MITLMIVLIVMVTAVIIMVIVITIIMIVIIGVHRLSSAHPELVSSSLARFTYLSPGRISCFFFLQERSQMRQH